MRVERCTSPACRRPYQVNEFDFGEAASGRVAAPISCPHCGDVQPGFGCRVVLVHALTEEQEREFERGQPPLRVAGRMR